MAKFVEGINEGNMDLFLAALRSGDFKQGKSQLVNYYKDDDGKREPSYCCLGVGSEVACDQGYITKTVRGESVMYDGAWALAPQSFIDWLGIPQDNLAENNGEYNVLFFKSSFDHPWDEHGGTITASYLNDALELDFPAIADVFEKEFTKED